MRFGEALAQHEIDGVPISRAGWNGKGMWVAKHNGISHIDYSYFEEDVHDATLYHIRRRWWEAPWVPSFMIMKEADGTIVFGWLASQTDIFASDWGPIPQD